MKLIKDKVKKALTENPRFRDSDNRLIAYIWWDECKVKFDPSEATFIEFLELFITDKLSNPESVRRSRQKVQEENIELRGNSYTHRQHSRKAFIKQL